jgi:transposase InsO family protein
VAAVKLSRPAYYRKPKNNLVQRQRRDQLGKPNQNAFIERFSKTYGDEVLSAHLLSILNQVREISEKWKDLYNEYQLHDALGRIPPAIYKRKLKLENSGLELCTWQGSLRFLAALSFTTQ